MSGVSGVGATPPPEPPQAGQQQESRQKQEIQEAINFLKSLLAEAGNNHGKISLAQYSQLIGKLGAIVNDPNMPVKLQNEAKSLINMLQASTKRVPGTNEVTLNMGVASRVLGDLQEMYKEAS